MAIAFDEDNNSPRGGVQSGRLVITRSGLTDWDDIEAYAAQLLPPTTIVGSAGGQIAGEALPGNSSLRVSGFEFEPFGDGRITGQQVSGINNFEKAHWVVTYERPTYAFSELDLGTESGVEPDEIDPVTFLTHSWSAGGEFLTLPTGSLKWKGDGTTVSEEVNAAIFIPTIEHEITWHRIRNPPFSVIRDRLGSVNNAALKFSTGTIAVETLVFLGANMDREVLSDGVRAWKLSYLFSEKRVDGSEDLGTGLDTIDVINPGGWNHWNRPEKDKGSFYRIVFDGASGDLDIYKRKDFTQLFQAAGA